MGSFSISAKRLRDCIIEPLYLSYVAAFKRKFSYYNVEAFNNT